MVQLEHNSPRNGMAHVTPEWGAFPGLGEACSIPRLVLRDLCRHSYDHAQAWLLWKSEFTKGRCPERTKKLVP